MASRPSKRSVERERYWRGIFEQQKESGLSTAAFCKQARITVSAFYNWKSLIGKRDKASSGGTIKVADVASTFVPMRITDEVAGSKRRSEVGHVEIWLRNGNIVRAGTMSPSAIAELVKSLDATC